MFCFEALALASIAAAACCRICCLARLVVSAAKSVSSILEMLRAIFSEMLVLLATMWSIRLLNATREALCELSFWSAVFNVIKEARAFEVVVKSIGAFI